MADAKSGNYDVFSPDISDCRRIICNDRFHSMKFVKSCRVPSLLPFRQDVCVDERFKIVKWDFKCSHV